MGDEIQRRKVTPVSIRKTAGTDFEFDIRGGVMARYQVSAVTGAEFTLFGQSQADRDADPPRPPQEIVDFATDAGVKRTIDAGWQPLDPDWLSVEWLILRSDTSEPVGASVALTLVS